VGAWLVLGLVGGLAIGLALGFTRRETSSGQAAWAPATRTSVHVSKEKAINTEGGAPAMLISPDGRRLAWLGGILGAVYVRPLDSFDVERLPGTENAHGLFFSPDSKRVGFLKEGALMSISISGGAPSKIVDLPGKTGFFRGASWGDDGYIVLAPSIDTGLFRVPESGGVLESVTRIDPASDVRTQRYPDVLPGAKVVLFTQDDKRTSEYHDDASIIARSLVTGEQHVIIEGAGRALYAAGHVVFIRAAELYAQRFDPETLSVSGSARKMVSGVEYNTTTGQGQFCLASDGTLAYVPGVDRTQSKRVAWRRPGEPADLFDLPQGTYEAPGISPDGRYVSYITVGANLSELWLYDLGRQAARRRLKQADLLVPIWSRDSKQIYFGSGLVTDPALFVLNVEGADAPRVVCEGEPGSFLTASTITPDGKSVLVIVDNKRGGVNIQSVDTESGELRDFIASSAVETQPTVDPSGKWVLFARAQEGDMQVYLTSMEPGGPLLQVSQVPGCCPRWAPDGKTIYYLPFGMRELWAVDVELGDRPILGTPRVFLEDFYWDLGKRFAYDVAPDGRILTFVDVGGSELGRELRVQRTWLGEEGRLAE